MEDAEIDGPLIDWKAKGSTVEYLGTEDVDGTLAHKLRVVRKNGDMNYVYLDPDHFLEIRIITQRMENGAQVENETDLGDYEKINGVFFPFSIEGGPKGSTDKQKIIFEKAEANTPIDEYDLQISRDRFQINLMRLPEILSSSLATCLAGAALAADQAPFNSSHDLRPRRAQHRLRRHERPRLRDRRGPRAERQD